MRNGFFRQLSERVDLAQSKIVKVTGTEKVRICGLECLLRRKLKLTLFRGATVDLGLSSWSSALKFPGTTGMELHVRGSRCCKRTHRAQLLMAQD
jgi:hypothetical protein